MPFPFQPSMRLKDVMSDWKKEIELGLRKINSAFCDTENVFFNSSDIGTKIIRDI